MSERVERYGKSWTNIDDDFSKKIWKLLGERKDVYHGYCDAVYFDFSVIPKHVNAQRDMYFLFGLTDNAEFVTMWIDRWEFDKPDDKS